MSTLLSLIFAGGLVLLDFTPGAPSKVNPEQLRAMPKAQLVEEYSRLCTSLMEHPKLKELEIPVLVEAFKSILEAVPKAQAEAIAKKSAANGKNGADDWKTINLKDMSLQDLRQMLDFYERVCHKNPDPTALDNVDLNKVVDIYQELHKNLPDHRKIMSIRGQAAVMVLSSDGLAVGNLFGSNQRRDWVPLNDIPFYVRQAFISAEDKDFEQHKGVDPYGTLRAFLKNIKDKGRPEGGSTITQQVTKNLVIGDALNFERKFKEMILAGRIEQGFKKDEILEVYLNMIYMGRGNFGIQLASRAYFSKTPKQLSLAEAALLAGMTRGPELYDPYRHPEVAKKRRNEVLDLMAKNKFLPAAEAEKAKASPLEAEPPNTEVPVAGYFIKALGADLNKRLPTFDLRSKDIRLTSTLMPEIQKITDQALRDGLIGFERRTGRYKWRGPIKNIASQLDDPSETSKREESSSTTASSPFFRKTQPPAPPAPVPTPVAASAPPAENKTLKELDPNWLKRQLISPAPELDWETVLVVQTSGALARAVKASGQTLIVKSSSIPGATLKRGDVVFAEAIKGDGYELRQPPEVQGAVVAMDPITGQVLALSGGFSYSLNQYNRAYEAERQPGSLMKPFTYLAALQYGLQPTMIIPDQPVTFDPIGPGAGWWSPENYDKKYRGFVTMRQALEDSINVPTTRLMGEIGLDRVRKLAEEMGAYEHAKRFYSFILGAQPTSLIRLVTAYSMIANGGRKIYPIFIKDAQIPLGTTSQNYPTLQSSWRKRVERADAVSFYQLRWLMQGVVAQGTAASKGASWDISDWADFIAGKTGTTNKQQDAWFIGFSKNLVVGVFVGYDNPDAAHRKFLGEKNTGATVALPIFKNVVEQVLGPLLQKSDFDGPPEGVQFLPIDYHYGYIQSPQEKTADSFIEAFRTSIIEEAGIERLNEDNRNRLNLARAAGQESFPRDNGSEEPEPQQVPPPDEQPTAQRFPGAPPSAEQEVPTGRIYEEPLYQY